MANPSPVMKENNPWEHNCDCLQIFDYSAISWTILEAAGQQKKYRTGNLTSFTSAYSIAAGAAEQKRQHLLLHSLFSLLSFACSQELLIFFLFFSLVFFAKNVIVADGVGVQGQVPERDQAVADWRLGR